MVFVYTGKGRRQAQRDDAPPEQKLCAKQACAIQWCLAKRDHKEDLCRAFIDDWQACCDKVRAGTVAMEGGGGRNNEGEGRLMAQGGGDENEAAS
ncbi:hypothetical protein ACHAXA_006153 [Cyclostephanos tholiformis]|uniref:Cx9C motif-containing protein 4, mitochondrial n=1 Tax=Cyclostephanos tholiformis TaxID=382380 RepID=A0ABD3RY98_9STRA